MEEKFTDQYGVKYADYGKTLVRCPIEFEGEYIVPDSVTTIDAFAFRDCTGLSGIVLPEGLKKIGDMAFDGCTSLEDISLPKSLESVATSAFTRKLILSYGIHVPEELTEIRKKIDEACHYWFFNSGVFRD